MKLAVVAASLSLSCVLAGLAGCATSVDDLGTGGAFDSSVAPIDAAHDGSANDSAVTKDTGGTPKDSGAPGVDSGAPGTDTGGGGDDTGSGDDTDPGIDSDLPDTTVDDTGVPPGDGSAGTCTVDTDCTFPYNCCDLTSNTCSVLFVFICLPAS